MRDREKREKIFRFKDGFEEEYLKPAADRSSNKTAYEDFQKRFAAKNNAMDRRAILIILGTRHKKKKNARTLVEKAVLTSTMKYHEIFQ